MLARAVDSRDAKARLDELLDEAAHGEEVVITRNGLPVARLVSLAVADGPREFGSARGLITITDDFDAPLEDFDGYR
jgi:prevent-host-death family protein